ncbi:uncharacterized protein DUF4302 [Chitinophaga niastensis]|uniref:Uncharacterized protein DUF4302 n=1 Tax=Chitinophaga niastensis TaxID=536980 RepID=A0A2P8HMT5_CHINA|nr:DUF4302 domain-containing protein [Chitinophaga niastensis]PSL47531.1 uncharacterized protein DUF4302 [Chitinophaga niastensis]
MRKNLVCLLLIITGIYACKKETDPVFDKSPDERINDTLRHYQEVLTSATYGWKGLVYPAGVPGSVFGFYFHFTASNRVEMFSDFEAGSTSTVHESSWRLKALQQPSLLFDTYSYLHVLCDPDAAHNGGSYGQGLGSDFEFAINGLHGDTLLLTGRFHGSKAVLIRATQPEQDAYYQHHINRAIDSVSLILTYFRQMNIGANKYDVSINKDLHQITFTWIVNGKVKQVTTGYYYTSNGIALSPAFNDSTTIISSFENVKWDGSAITGSINGSNAGITETARPVAVDGSAPKRWYQHVADQGSYWASYYGFHVNGVDDAYHIIGLPAYVGVTYWPNINGPGSFDLLGFVLRQGSERPSVTYGPGYDAPTFTTDGRIIFNDNGLYGSLPANIQPVLKTRAAMADPQGFFLVQKSSTTYDMVSASDGKSWINWSGN